MPEVPKIGSNNAPIGSMIDFEDLQRAAKEKIAIQIEMEGDRIRNQYGEVSDHDIWQILRTEKEIAQCKSCKGLPCQKKKNQCFVPNVSYDEVFGLNISNAVCSYEKARRLQANIERLTGLSKIPAEYLGKTFDDYQVDSRNAYAVKVAKKLIERPNNGAFFFGDVGTGKTFLAAILAQEIIKQGRQVIFATVPTISMRLRATFNRTAKRNEAGETVYRQPPTEEDILEKLFTVPTLILDDVGLEKPTRFVCSTIGNIFNERYNARLQTIMTSNYTLKQIQNIFDNPSDGDTTFDGTRIYDRCKQMCVPVEFKGESRRA